MRDPDLIYAILEKHARGVPMRSDTDDEASSVTLNDRDVEACFTRTNLARRREELVSCFWSGWERLLEGKTQLDARRDGARQALRRSKGLLARSVFKPPFGI